MDKGPKGVWISSSGRRVSVSLVVKDSWVLSGRIVLFLCLKVKYRSPQWEPTLHPSGGGQENNGKCHVLAKTWRNSLCWALSWGLWEDENSTVSPLKCQTRIIIGSRNSTSRISPKGLRAGVKETFAKRYLVCPQQQDGQRPTMGKKPSISPWMRGQAKCGPSQHRNSIQP